MVPQGVGSARRLRFSFALARQWLSVNAHSFLTRDAHRPSASTLLRNGGAHWMTDRRTRAVARSGELNHARVPGLWLASVPQ